jgi:hypothetical protein
MNGIIEMEIQPGTALSPEEAASAYQTEQEVMARIKELRDDSLEVNRLEFGRLFRQLQKIHARSGRHGQFTKQVEELGFARTTVYRWIDEYTRQVSHRKSEDQAIQLQANKSSHVGQLSSQTIQDHELTAKSCGSSLDGDDTWQGLADPSLSEDVLGTHVGKSAEAENRVNCLDTAEGRSEWLFRHALDVFGRANKASGQALREWDDAAARVRKVLASYKRDEVDNPNADFSPIAREDE